MRNKPHKRNLHFAALQSTPIFLADIAGKHYLLLSQYDDVNPADYATERQIARATLRAERTNDGE